MLCFASKPPAAKQSNDPAITIENKIIMAIKITVIKNFPD